MKRKVMNTGKLRLSPNEEAFILKEDYERRRKLRLLQVREQERGIAFQIREDIKQRKNQQFSRLAGELRAEWEKAQNQKIQNLEKLYLASLRHMGDGHRQAKENEPDLDALARRAAERKRKAEMRHKEALKVQKNQKEMLMKQKTRHIKARKEALLVEKERSAKVARLPPPVPAPFENIELNRIPSLKTNSSTYHHISTFVSRQMDTKQPDAHLAAEEEARRLEGLRKQAAQERMEQLERAHVRGSQALKKIHLTQTQERLLEELKQLQKEDLARRRQTVAQMPPRLVELPHRRLEGKEDWQRELEFAFEDMYSVDRKVKGNVILHLKPEPLPAMSDQLRDEELDLSMERENQVPFGMKTQQIPSRILFKRLLNKIRSQQSLWTIKSVSEDESEVTTSTSEVESKAPTVESGAMILEERTLSSEQEQVMDSDRLTIESGPLSSEDKPFFCQADAGKEQAVVAFPPATAEAQSSVLLHPQEEAVRIRMSARHKQIMEIEEQKRKQLELLEQIEQQKLRLETDCFRAQLEEENRKKTQQPEVCPAPMSHTVISDEDCHRQMIRNYQHQLLQQNRLHKQSVETARKRLLEYQTILRERYPSMSSASLISDSIMLGPPQKSQKPAAASEHWGLCQRLKPSPNKYQPVQSSQTPGLDQSHVQALRQDLFPQRQGETGALEMLAKQFVGSQEHPQQSSHVEASQRNYKFVPKYPHALSRTLSYDRLQTLQDAGEVSKPLRAITCQTLDSQQISSEDSENISSKPTEPSSFLPLVPERSFTSLPVKLESGKVQEPFTTMSKSRVSINQSVISQMHDQPLSSSDTITTQQDDLKFPPKQLELQKEILQASQEAQEKLVLYTQKELEKQAGLPVFIPSSAGDLVTSLPSASAESGRIQTFSTESDATVSSGNMDKLWGFSQPVLSQQTNLEFPQEQMGVQKDNLRARWEAQEVLLAHKQSKLDDIVNSEQTGHSWPHQVTQQSFSSLSVTDRLSRKIQERPLPTNKKGLLPSQSEMSRSQDGSSSSLQHILPLHNSLKSLQERLATQRDAAQTRHEAQEELLLHRERSLGDMMSGPVNSLSSVVSQHSDASHVVSEPGPKESWELYSSEGSIVPSSHLITPSLEEESLDFPQHNLPTQHFTTLQEQAHIQRVILGAKKETTEYAHRENELEKGLRSQQTGALSSSQVAEWERLQEFISVKSDNAGPLSLKIPGFWERLDRFSQHAFPLQNNLQEHQEWVNTEKESFQFSPQARENSSSQQTGFSSFIPSLGPSSCVSLPSADSGTTQQPLSTESDSKVTSIHLQIPELQDRLLKISQLIQPQQDSLKAIEKQLATQREAIVQSRQEAHDEILGERKERVFPKQPSPSPLIPQHSLASFPLSDSERTQELCSAISDDAVSSGSEMLGLPGRALGLSHTDLFQQNNLAAHPEHLHAQTNAFHSTEKVQEEMLFPRPCEHSIQPHHGDLKTLQQQLNVQRKAIRSGQEIQEELLLQRLNKLEQRVSCKQISSSSFSPQVALPVANSEGTLQSFPTKSDDTEISGSHEAKSKSIGELSLPKKEHGVPSRDAVIPRLQDRRLSFSPPVLAQHDDMNLQKQLNLQREALHCRQRAQEDLLVQRQTALQQQMEKHRETVKELLNVSQARTSPDNDLKMQGPAWGGSDQESPSGESLGKELSGRASKPPVSKVKCGLDLNQHELSTIQEVESPASGRTSMPGKSDFYQDRDPLRVSVSREQSFLGSPLAHDLFACHQPPAQNSRSNDYYEAVNVEESDVEDHAILSHAVSEEACTSLGPVVKPDDKAETQDISQEPLSSVTVSTGSFLSYELTDLSLTDPESFSEQMEHQEQEETSPFSCARPSTPVTYQQLHSLGADDFLLSTEEERASSHTRAQQVIDKDINEATLIPGKRDLQVPAVDFPELEHVFPHLHRQLFRPLEPYLDFDLWSSSGISQDNRDFYERSTSTACFTELRASLQPVGNPAHAAAQSFAAEGSFQQLLPELSSQESQHVDLPSIYSIEARGTSQNMETHSSSEQTEVLQNKKRSVHFQSSAESLSPAYSSSDDAVFDQLHLQHSTPCGSTSSECSGKQLGSRKEMLGFEELSRKAVTVLPSHRLAGNESEVLNPHVEETDSKGSHSISTENEKSVQDPRKLSQLAQAQHIKNSKSFSFQSSIPVWETESGYGIMEEPDLTLLSTSDISTTETNLANLTLEERDSEAQGCFQAGASLPPLPETSGYGAASEEPCTHQPQVAPSATQKKSFMERSYQRQREMRNKSQPPQTGSSLSRLKGVNKVRVSLPEDRKTTQALMHQRALRLYRQLSEVKQQREEKAKQELCAQNGARAKEFHKKTLEKLRAKNTC